MHRVAAALIALTIWTLPVASSAEPAAKPAAKATAHADTLGGWPATRAGALGHGWVAAFSSGDSAMRAYTLSHVSAKSLAERGMDERMGRYRDLHEKYGKLVLASVLKETPTELTARLMSADAAMHEFIFTIETGDSPKLVSVAIREGMHGGFGAFHH